MLLERAYLKLSCWSKWEFELGWKRMESWLGLGNAPAATGMDAGLCPERHGPEYTTGALRKRET